MRHRLSRRQLGRTASHRKALINNQVTDLLRHDRIVTTEAKAKEVRPIAERVITLGKRGDSAARRRAGALLTDKKVLRRLFDEVAPRFQDRPGGYTRIVKLGPRLGDGARMAQLELVEGAVADTIIESAPAPAADAPPAEGPADDSPDADTAGAALESDDSAGQDTTEPPPDGDPATDGDPPPDDEPPTRDEPKEDA